MKPEEIDQKLSEWLKTHKDHIVLIDHMQKGDILHLQMTWQEFFINLPHIKRGSRNIVLIKNDAGPMIIWTQKNDGNS